MPEPHTFLYTDEQWEPIARELLGIDRNNPKGDRADLELAASLFVNSRSHLGMGLPSPKKAKGLPSPKKAQKAWLNVAAAARKLKDAVDALEPAGAASFSIIDNHSKQIGLWADGLVSIEGAARSWAEYEVFGFKQPPNNSDPIRGQFIDGLIEAWRNFGGNIGSSVNPATGEPGGPLLRFLAAAAGPAFEAASEAPPSRDMLRAAVRSAKER